MSLTRQVGRCSVNSDRIRSPLANASTRYSGRTAVGAAPTPPAASSGVPPVAGFALALLAISISCRWARSPTTGGRYSSSRRPGLGEPQHAGRPSFRARSQTPSRTAHKVGTTKDNRRDHTRGWRPVTADCAGATKTPCASSEYWPTLGLV